MDVLLLLLLLPCVFSAALIATGAAESSFDQNFYPVWGNNHISLLEQGHQAQLLMDQSSGAGFASKLSYGSGFFRMRMKLPNKRSGGVITTFYLTSKPVNQDQANHDELDFEFIGSNGRGYTLSTNIITGEILNREQQFHLWFDPTADFHSYQFLWNQHQIVFFVDDIPIRVYKNFAGARYFSRAMHIEGTIWNDLAWTGPVDWSQGPFTAYFEGFNVDACPNNPQQCSSSTPANYWNSKQYWQLDPVQLGKYKATRSKYIFYDYCTKAPQPECGQQPYL